MTQEELKEVIKCVHEMYYTGKFLESPEEGLKFHRHMEILFNYANIEDSLVKNNPDKVSPEQFAESHRIVE